MVDVDINAADSLVKAGAVRVCVSFGWPNEMKMNSRSHPALHDDWPTCTRRLSHALHGAAPLVGSSAVRSIEQDDIVKQVVARIDTIMVGNRASCRNRQSIVGPNNGDVDKIIAR